jgi:hypothetical protein
VVPTEVNYQDFLKLAELDRPVVVINNFLKNPDEVRALALRYDYQEDKVYPGRRTPKQVIEGPFVRALERFVGKPILKMESLFQIQPEGYDKDSFIHGDLCDWAAVLYLNKDRDGTPGTSFFRHKETGMDRVTLGIELMFQAIERGVQPDVIAGPATRDRFDMDKWDVTLTVPVQYNRLVLYNAKLFHRNASAWGTDVTDARLVQGLFLYTEPMDAKRTAGLDMLERQSVVPSV